MRARWQDASMELARSLWLRVETIHAVTYFGAPTTAGGLTAEGRALRASIEATTDRLAVVPLDALEADERTTLLAALAPVASAIATSGVIRYPNPMGLPAFRG